MFKTKERILLLLQSEKDVDPVWRWSRKGKSKYRIFRFMKQVGFKIVSRGENKKKKEKCGNNGVEYILKTRSCCKTSIPSQKDIYYVTQILL